MYAWLCKECYERWNRLTAGGRHRFICRICEKEAVFDVSYPHQERCPNCDAPPYAGGKIIWNKIEFTKSAADFLEECQRYVDRARTEHDCPTCGITFSTWYSKTPSGNDCFLCRNCDTLFTKDKCRICEERFNPFS